MEVEELREIGAGLEGISTALNEMRSDRMRELIVALIVGALLGALLARVLLR